MGRAVTKRRQRAITSSSDNPKPTRSVIPSGRRVGWRGTSRGSRCHETTEARDNVVIRHPQADAKRHPERAAGGLARDLAWVALSRNDGSARANVVS